MCGILFSSSECAVNIKNLIMKRGGNMRKVAREQKHRLKSWLDCARASERAALFALLSAAPFTPTPNPRTSHESRGRNIPFIVCFIVAVLANALAIRHAANKSPFSTNNKIGLGGRAKNKTKKFLNLFKEEYFISVGVFTYSQTHAY